MSTLRTTTLKHGSSAIDNIVFDNQGRSTFGNNALFVNAQTQRVGVNTTSPTVALDVVGAINATGNVNFSGQLNLTGNLAVDTNILFVDTVNNRVGVGTASPDRVFHVSAGFFNPVRVQSTQASSRIEFQSSATASFDTVSCGSNGNDFEINTNTAGGGTRRLTIKGDGNVGINITAPDAILHVKKGNSGSEASGTWLARLTNATDAVTENGLVVASRWSAGGNIPFLVGNTGGGFRTYLRVDGDGRVGIGSQATRQFFEVFNGTKDQGLCVVRNNTGAIEQRIILSTHSGGNTITNAWLGSNPKTLVFESFNGTTDVSTTCGAISSIGNWGIGLSSPISKFHIRVVDETNFLVREEGTALVLSAETNSGRDNNRGLIVESTEVVFNSNGTERCRLNGTGNLAFANGLGIDFSATEGTGASSSLLDDYEEGFWTPSINGITSYSVQNGQYTKVGNLVTFTCRVDGDTATPGATILQITGLPYQNGATSATSYGGAFRTFGIMVDDATNTNMNLHIPLNQSSIRFYSSNDVLDENDPGINLTQNIIIHGFYYTTA